jgi:hypothetical protein
MKRRGDVQEGPERERLGMQLLLQQFERLESLQRTYDSATIKIEFLSRMADDDLRTEYAPLSGQISGLDNAATDHLRTLREFVLATDGGIPMMSGYTLIRTAVEACSVGLWLMGAGTKDARILNSLRLTLSNRIDLESTAKQLGAAAPEKDRHVRDRLDEIKNSKPSLRQRTIGPMPSTTSIVTQAQKHITKRAPYTGIQVWLACSGIAHGNTSVGLALLERKRVGLGGPRGATFMVTSSVSVLASMFEVAVDFLEAMRHMYAAHCKTTS